MQPISARHLLGTTLCTDSNKAPTVFGVVESFTINPTLMTVDGFLIGTPTKSANRTPFLARECVTEFTATTLYAYDKLTRTPVEQRRILNLSAWTLHPKVMVGFVYDVHFFPESGMIESFVIHQLLRTWRVPASAVTKITPRALYIDNDTRIKLEITPFPN